MFVANSTFAAVLVAAVFGSILAYFELVGRYWVAIRLALPTVRLWIYVAVQGIIAAWTAFVLVGNQTATAYLLGRHESAINLDSIESAFIGFGSTLISFVALHTSITQLRVAGRAVSIGPQFVLNNLVSWVDHAIDERAAKERSSSLDWYFRNVRDHVSDDPMTNEAAVEVRKDESLMASLAKIVDKRFLDIGAEDSIDETTARELAHGVERVKRLERLGLVKTRSASVGSGAVVFATRLGLLVADALGIEDSKAGLTVGG